MKKINVILISLLVLSVNAASAAKLDPVFAQPTSIAAASTEFADPEFADEKTQIQEQFEKLVQNFLDTKAPSKAKRAGVVIGRSVLAALPGTILAGVKFANVITDADAKLLCLGVALLLVGLGIDGAGYLLKCKDKSFEALKKINEHLANLSPEQKTELTNSYKKILKKITKKIEMEKNGAGMKFASVVCSGDIVLAMLSFTSLLAGACCCIPDGRDFNVKYCVGGGALVLASIAAFVAGIISPIYKYKHSPSKQKEALLANIKKMLTKNDDEEAVA